MDNQESNRIFGEYLKLSAIPPAKGGRRPDYIVWPETAVPFVLTENPAALQSIGRMLKPRQTLITGAVRVEEEAPGDKPRYYNSILVIDDKGETIAAADKLHLVPFGEYMPFADFFTWLGVPAIAMPGGFSPGTVRSTLNLGKSLVALPLICYEVIFPGAIAAAGPAPDFILNVTNDAWYGRTTGPYQHLRQAQIRAVETGLPLLRAGDNGISVVTDAYGRIIAGIRLDDVGVLDATIGGKNPHKLAVASKTTIFWLLMAIFLIAAIFSRKGLYRERN
ncbi:MAG TPA: apolipoprotein N-acyltransferase, partial [Pararhizobium sp.]|nr:apolipoprotein N-acyltransferase [Pararhizobium sp.]